MTALQPVIQSRILALREQRVMLDADLAQLYGVETRVLVQAVKRNLARFPEDFMFQLSAQEFANLRSQTVISSAASSTGHGGRRSAPYAFTEQGVAMLSTVLGSPRAIAVNIEIMRTFVRVRALAATHADLAKRLAELEDKTEALTMSHDTFSRTTRAQLKQVFDALRELMTPPDPPKRPIGFVTPQEKGKKTEGAKRKN
jgi:ORF6N domain